jgi:hypothetical protein
MAGVQVTTALDEAPAFVAAAVEHLAACLGETHPTVVAGRRFMASLAAIPDGAVLVTEEALAVAIHRVWPFRRSTATVERLSAASLLAALRTGPR